MDDKVYSVIDRVLEYGSCPGVVDYRLYALASGQRGNLLQVLKAEGKRCGALQIDNSGVRPDRTLDVLCRAAVNYSALYTVSCQILRSDVLGPVIGILYHDDVVTALQAAEDGKAYGRNTGGHELCPGTVLQLSKLQLAEIDGRVVSPCVDVVGGLIGERLLEGIKGGKTED